MERYLLIPIDWLSLGSNQKDGPYHVESYYKTKTTKSNNKLDKCLDLDGLIRALTHSVGDRDSARVETEMQEMGKPYLENPD